MRHLKLPILSLVVALLAACTLSGCGVYRAVFGEDSAIQIAETREQKHWAWIATYDNLQQSAEDIVTSNDAPIQLRRTVQTIEQCTTPTILELSKLFHTYISERLLMEQGESTLDKIEIAAANYDRWSLKAQEAITSLGLAISGEESSCRN